MRKIFAALLLIASLAPLSRAYAIADYSNLRLRCLYDIRFANGWPAYEERSEAEYFDIRDAGTLKRWSRPPRSGVRHVIGGDKKGEYSLSEVALPGDSVKFLDQNVFPLNGFFGSGGNVQVFDSTYQNQRVALRVAQYTESDDGKFEMVSEESFVKGVAIYKKLGISTVDIVGHARNFKWVAVGVVDKKFEMAQLLLPAELAKLRTRFGDAEVKKAQAGLVEFYKSLRKIAYLEDWGTFQVVWNGKKWIVVDPADPVIVLTEAMLIKNPAMILKGPIHPDLGKDTYNLFVQQRLRNLRADFPLAYEPVLKFLRES